LNCSADWTGVFAALVIVNPLMRTHGSIHVQSMRDFRPQTRYV
jgi:hypothetical protein